MRFFSPLSLSWLCCAVAAQQVQCQHRRSNSSVESNSHPAVVLPTQVFGDHECELDFLVSGGGAAGLAFVLEIYALRQQSKLLLLEKRAQYTRQQILVLQENATSQLKNNTNVNVQYLTKRSSPVNGGRLRTYIPPVPGLLGGWRSNAVAKDVEEFLWKSVNELKNDRGWANLELKRPANIDPETLRLKEGCVEFEMSDSAGKKQVRNSRYLVVAEGARSTTLDFLGILPELHTTKKSERVTYYWSQEVSHPSFGGDESEFALSTSAKTYGFLALPPNLERNSIREYVEWKFSTQQRQQPETPQPDKIGFGSPQPGRDVGTFTVQLQHRLTKPADWAEHLFLVGDSLSTVDPMTGFGLNKALVEAVITARYLNKKLNNSLQNDPNAALALQQEFYNWLKELTDFVMSESEDRLDKVLVEQRVVDDAWDRYLSTLSSGSSPQQSGAANP